MGLLDYDIQLAKQAIKRAPGLLNEYAGQLNSKLRDTLGLDNARADYAMRNLDAMAGGDLKQARAENNKQLASKMVDLGMNFNPAAVGMVVYHGSPHKFNKFDISKIGTGEGAQAYGHGLYMAEAPSVAQGYQRDVTRAQMLQGKTPEVDRIGNAPIEKFYEQIQRKADRMPPAQAEVEYEKLAFLEDLMQQPSFDDALKRIDNDAIAPWAESLRSQYKPAGQLYKVDIPDEAVARFLDWDKPLSQQAPEVQAAIQKLNPTATQEQIALAEAKKQAAYDAYMSRPASMDADAERSLETAYSQAYRAWQDAKGLNSAQGSLIYHGLAGKGKDASRLLQEAGIPGIRYLDGGSRGAGNGTSNFVLFDDQMPRILEINGTPTGNKPWNPGEYGLLR